MIKEKTDMTPDRQGVVSIIPGEIKIMAIQYGQIEQITFKTHWRQMA